jgi:putative phosphoesterase
MKIGLLSDTHGHLDKHVFNHFSQCDEIWHAGDIGSQELADALEKFKPLRAVYGNIDDALMQRRFPENLEFTCGDLSILITHIAGVPPNYNTRVKGLLRKKSADVLICGHSHILKVIRDPAEKLLFINPGAAGNHGFHHMKTLLRFDILGKEIKNMEVIELGKRGAIEAR